MECWSTGVLEGWVLIPVLQYSITPIRPLFQRPSYG